MISGHKGGQVGPDQGTEAELCDGDEFTVLVGI
jgi:hypothetical protein